MKTVAWPLARLDFMYHQNMLEIACTLIIVSQAQSSSTVTQVLMNLNSTDKKSLPRPGRCQTLENYPANLYGISKMYGGSLLWTHLCLILNWNG